MKIINQPIPVWMPKGWGGEKWIDNRREYCCKILNIVKDKRLSVHYHTLKTETFYCLFGKVKIKFHDDPEELYRILTEKGEDFVVESMETMILGQDETFFVPPRRVHQIIGMMDSKLIEVSTQHFEEDSYRIVKGD